MFGLFKPKTEVSVNQSGINEFAIDTAAHAADAIFTLIIERAALRLDYDNRLGMLDAQYVLTSMYRVQFYQGFLSQVLCEGQADQEKFERLILPAMRKALNEKSLRTGLQWMTAGTVDGFSNDALHKLQTIAAAGFDVGIRSALAFDADQEQNEADLKEMGEFFRNMHRFFDPADVPQAANSKRV
ncbi:MAG: hypothetical protein QNI90_12810 [Dinoroseobacter sp.]|nr:hypothetical protein [Dinoroseobacter sp.]